MNELCHACERVTPPHTWTRNAMRMKKSSDTHEWAISRIWKSHHTPEWAMSCIWKSHATHIEISFVWRIHVTHVNEQCHAYERVTWQTWMSNVTHLKESHDTHDLARSQEKGDSQAGSDRVYKMVTFLSSLGSHCSFMCVMWLFYTPNITHLCVWCDYLCTKSK